MARGFSRTGLGVALGFVVAGAGCAQQRPQVNRVQADVLPKTFFVGENIQDGADDPVFYSRGFSIAQSVGQEQLTPGTYTGMDKIRWEITEDRLNARKAYQQVIGRDNKGLNGPGTDPNGTLVASYKITEHFDVRRSYNTTTGEETNVVEENKQDRPWNERAFMRVDWATNIVNDPMWSETFFGHLFGGFKLTPMTYYVNDPSSDEAPHFEEKDGYLDITNRYFVEPTTLEFSWGSLPMCLIEGYYTGTANHDCNNQEASIRWSFWKVPDTDFEPLDQPRASLDIIANFGGSGDSRDPGFGAPRQEYDPAYGYTDSGYHAYVGMHNIWQKSHVDGATCVSNADTDANGTADDCEGKATSGGSQCDPYKKLCTIPYRDRKVKTVPYFVNKEMDAKYQDPVDASGKPTARGAAEDIIFSWNQMLTNAVAYAREAECRRTGDGDRPTCHASYFSSDGTPATMQMVSYGGWLIEVPSDPTPVLTMCHNPVRDYDLHEQCGATGYRARVGDVRRNFMIDWPYDSRARYGGLAGLFNDPETGEYFGNTATTVYIARRARRILDSLLVAMGDITLDDYIAGVPADTVARTLSSSSSAPRKALTEAEMAERIAAVNRVNLGKSLAPGAATGSLAQKVTQAALDATHPGDPAKTLAQGMAQTDAVARPLQSSPLMGQLVDSNWLLNTFGADPKAPVSADMRQEASPFAGLDAAKLKEIDGVLNARDAAMGACYVDRGMGASAGSVVNVSLAKYFLNKYGSLSREERAQKMLDELSIESFKGVMLHEFGHSLGMRHQFASSWDAPNYMPQYWQLRTQEGQAAGNCQGKPRDTSKPDACMGPRYLDPATDDEMGLADESRPAIEYFGNTSTMEYQSERFSETSGLGQWDSHMSNAVYGRVLETFDKSVTSRKEQSQFLALHLSQLISDDLVYSKMIADDPAMQSTYDSSLFGTAPFLHGLHYTNLARSMKIFDPARDCRDATDEEKATAKWHVVHGKVCATTPKDHAAWSDFRSDTTKEVKSQGMDALVSWHTRPDIKDAEQADSVRWPFRYGESYSDSYVHTNMTDAGADEYEVTVNLARQFDADYPDLYFRKKNRDYAGYRLASSTLSRFFERLRSYHWSIANTSLRYLSYGKSLFDALAGDDNWHRGKLMANAEAFNVLERSVLMPQPGTYGPNDAYKSKTRPIYDVSNSAGGFNVPIVQGRYIDTTYDLSAGGSWDYQNYIVRQGFYVEKAYAFLALTDSRPTLSTISRENYLDGRDVALNFRSDMPEAFDRLLGGLLSEDWESLGMWVPANATGDVTPKLFDLTVTDKAPTREPGALVLFPNIGYQQQLYAGIFAALYARVNTDMTLVNKMRVWVDGAEGNISDVAFPNEADQIRFVDPSSNFTYIARRYGTETLDGKVVDRGLASRMLQHANDLVLSSYETTKGKDGQPMIDKFGSPVLVHSSSGDLKELDPMTSQRGRLKAFVGLLDGIREAGRMLGNGPLD